MTAAKSRKEELEDEALELGFQVEDAVRELLYICEKVELPQSLGPSISKLSNFIEKIDGNWEEIELIESSEKN